MRDPALTQIVEDNLKSPVVGAAQRGEPMSIVPPGKYPHIIGTDLDRSVIRHAIHVEVSIGVASSLEEYGLAIWRPRGCLTEFGARNWLKARAIGIHYLQLAVPKQRELLAV